MTGSSPQGFTISDVIVDNTNITLKSTDFQGGWEPSIAVNPVNPSQVVVTSFSSSWGANAALWYSTDGGLTWTEYFSIPAPPGRTTGSGCPCDQTVDFDRSGHLFGVFQIQGSSGQYQIVTGDTSNPASSAAWQWRDDPVQLTDLASTNTDQPWLLVNGDPVTPTTDNVYVNYNDFNAVRSQVSVSKNATPPNFTVDHSADSVNSNWNTNPGLRLAKDPRNGTMYALWQTSTTSPSPHATVWHVNRSTDGGTTWTLNGSTDGIAVMNGQSDNGLDFKFGGVNTLLGGVQHLAVDPTNGDVYVVVGHDSLNNGAGNQIYLDHLVTNASGQLVAAPGNAITQVSAATSAALPSIAVTSDGTIGVLYDTYDGPVNGFPSFSVHFAQSGDHGQTFTDTVLEQFLSPSTDNGPNTRQRILGDFQQLKAVGNTFYGVFAGNRVPFVGGATSVIDPVFFSKRAAADVPPAPRDDFDGDGKTDVAVFRPSEGRWYVDRSSDSALAITPFGLASDIPLPADYDGDQKSDIAVFRPSEGRWYVLRSSDAALSLVDFGTSGDVPVPADYDGDGKADLAVFRPSEGRWYIRRSSDSGLTMVDFGLGTDVPVPADYDGDGKTDVAVFRQSEGRWYVRLSGGIQTASFGLTTDVPVPADYDGDGTADLAVFRPSEGRWYIASSAGSGLVIRAWGAVGDRVEPADYDGDHAADVAVFRGSEGRWYVRSSSGGALSLTNFGLSSDIQLSLPYALRRAFYP